MTLLGNLKRGRHFANSTNRGVVEADICQMASFSLCWDPDCGRKRCCPWVSWLKIRIASKTLPGSQLSTMFLFLAYSFILLVWITLWFFPSALGRDIWDKLKICLWPLLTWWDVEATGIPFLRDLPLTCFETDETPMLVKKGPAWSEQILCCWNRGLLLGGGVQTDLEAAGVGGGAFHHGPVSNAPWDFVSVPHLCPRPV